jgi:hypothetical protein
VRLLPEGDRERERREDEDLMDTFSIWDMQ